MSFWLELQFELRNRFLGRIRLRPGLPHVNTDETPEHRFYQLLLERALDRNERETVRSVVDIGSRNGSYLPALARAFSHAEIHGIELDGGRRNWNGFRRADYGAAYARALVSQGRSANYHWGDTRNLSADTLRLATQSPVLVTLFYPFVSLDPCVSWGLPARYADYNSVLRHLREWAHALPEANLRILSAHQGEWEKDRARSAYETSGLEVSEVRVKQAEFAALWPSEHDAFLLGAVLDPPSP